jgi:hypothetical protein
MKIVMLEFMFYWIAKRYVICMYQSWHGGFRNGTCYVYKI